MKQRKELSDKEELPNFEQHKKTTANTNKSMADLI